MRQKNISTYLWLLAAIVAAPNSLVVLPQQASAQDTEQTATTKTNVISDRDPVTTNIKMFALHHIDSSEAVAVVRELMHGEEDLTLVLEHATNSIIARGPEDTLNMVEALLARMDRSNPPAAPAEENRTVQVYTLRYVTAKLAYGVLLQLLADDEGGLSLDTQMNRLVVAGTPATHDAVAQALQQLDRQESGSRQMTTERSSESSEARIKLMRGVAEQHHLAFEWDPNLDLVVVRGVKSSIESYQETLNTVLPLFAKRSSVRAADAISAKYAIRVVWLASGKEKVRTELPDDLAAIRKTAARFGMRNLTSIGQLIAYTRAEIEDPASFAISGVAVNGGQRFRLGADGNIAAIDLRRTAFALRLSIHTSLVTEDPSQLSQSIVAEVDMQLGVGKPVIVAAAPFEGNHSIFVVEIVEGL